MREKESLKVKEWWIRFYSHWKGNSGGGFVPLGSIRTMLYIDEEWWSLPFRPKTGSTASKLLWSCRLRPNGCIECGFTIGLNPFPGLCGCGDDRRERAREESWTEPVRLSHNILHLSPPLSEYGPVLRNIWAWPTDPPGRCGLWLLRVWSACMKANCFPSL